MRGHILFILVIALGVFSSCSKDDTDGLFLEYASSQALTSDVTISLMEQKSIPDSIQIDEEGLYLYIETTELYPYCNFGILRSTFQEGDTLVIRLEDIVKPGVTLSPDGPASTNVLIPENTKQIVFLRGSESDSFSLEIEEDALILNPVSTSFSSADHTIYLRK